MGTLPTTYQPVYQYTQKRDLYRRVGKGRRCCLGDRIASTPCRASCFSPGRFEEFILFFITPWCKIAGAARSWINSVPQSAATALPSLLYKSFCYASTPEGSLIVTISVYGSSYTYLQFSLIAVSFPSLSLFWRPQCRLGCLAIDRSRKEERIRPTKKLHELQYTEVAKSGIIRCTSGSLIDWFVYLNC